VHSEKNAPRASSSRPTSPDMPHEEPCLSRAHVPPPRSDRGGARIVCEVDGKVAVVTLNRPSRRNALDREMLVTLSETLGGLRNRTGVLAVILTGSGSSFCSGVDISVEGRRTFYQPPQAIERLYQENGQAIVRALQSLPQVTIAAVNGPAVGWGTCLATCCDFRVVSDRAIFRIPEIGLGMYYDVGCLYGLLALVGPAFAKRMTMLGEDIDAAEAVRRGLADRVAPAADLLATAHQVARTLVACKPATLRWTKRRILAATVSRRRPLGMTELEVTTAYYGSNTDRFEGLAATKEGRQPLFSREQ
jgi:enoyl-CoA hydratase/carnithine racemase